jgi:hypothetical protein
MMNKMVSAAMAAAKPSLRALPPLLAGLISLLALGRAGASDNSKSTLEVFELLALAGSSPVTHVAPPPIVARPKPPSLEVLQQQLATDEQTLADQQAGLTSAQSMLAFFGGQATELSKASQDPQVPADQQAEDAEEAQELTQLNVPQWMAAVASDEQLVARIEAQIATLQLQIAAAQ